MPRRSKRLQLKKHPYVMTQCKESLVQFLTDACGGSDKRQSQKRPKRGSRARQGSSALSRRTMEEDVTLHDGVVDTDLHSVGLQSRSRRKFLEREPPRPSAEQRNVTFVTGLYDIGRGDWKHYRRTMSQYLDYFSYFLKLNVMMYVFCEPEVAEYVRQNRRDYHDNTFIHELSFQNLEFYTYRKSIEKVMGSKEFRRNNKLLNHPECFSPEYVIITNSKVSFIKIASERDPFNTSHFVWVDAGYGHGTGVYPSNRQWSPIKLLGLHRKITFIQLRDIEADDDIDLHKDKSPVLAGGFFGGDKWAIAEYYRTYREVFCACLNKSIVDDDQSIALYTYFRDTSLFQFFHGDWYDAVKIYS